MAQMVAAPHCLWHCHRRICCPEIRGSRTASIICTSRTTLPSTPKGVRQRAVPSPNNAGASSHLSLKHLRPAIRKLVKGAWQWGYGDVPAETAPERAGLGFNSDSGATVFRADELK